MAEIRNRDKLHKKYRITNLEIDDLSYRYSRNKVKTLINLKKQTYIQDSLEENKRDSKKLWKTLRNLGLPSKSKSDSKINLNIEGELNSKSADIADHFNNIYSTLAENLVRKLPNAPNKFGEFITANYYQEKNLRENNFIFQKVDKNEISKILNNINPDKSPGCDNIPGRFLKDGSEIICTHISAIFNLSVSLSKFPTQCKIAKIKPIFKKALS